MLSRIHWRIKFDYAGYGALMFFVEMVFSPAMAQRDNFGEIELTSSMDKCFGARLAQVESQLGLLIQI